MPGIFGFAPIQAGGGREEIPLKTKQKKEIEHVIIFFGARGTTDSDMYIPRAERKKRTKPGEVYLNPRERENNMGRRTDMHMGGRTPNTLFEVI
jgi:hypothetical protein